MISKAERVRRKHERVLDSYRGYLAELALAYKNHDDRKLAIEYRRLIAFTQGVYALCEGGEYRYYRKHFDEIFIKWKEEHEILITNHNIKRSNKLNEH